MPAATHLRPKTLPLLRCPLPRAGQLSLRLMMTAWLRDKRDHSTIHRPRERTWVSLSTCTRSTGTRSTGARLAFQPVAENLRFGRQTLPAVLFCCLHSYIGMSQRKVFDLNPLHEFHPETPPLAGNPSKFRLHRVVARPVPHMILRRFGNPGNAYLDAAELRE